MSGKKILISKVLETPVTPGVHYRIVCMTGKNKGVGYTIQSDRIILGRGESADVDVHDTKASREHAELTKVDHNYILTDLGSQNGVVVNDLKVAQHTLKENDKIVIGQTVFKYSIYNVSEENVPANVSEELVEKDSEEEEKELELSDDDVQKKKKKKLIIIAAVAVLVMFLMMSEDNKEPRQKKSKDRKSVTDTFTAMQKKKNKEEDREVHNKLESILHRGQREFREANYHRAISEFNLALVLKPKHGRASYYLARAKQALDAEIERNFLKARRDTLAKKYRTATVSYCAVIKLLGKGYSTDDRYKSAEDNIRKLEQAMGLDSGEIKCIEGE